MIITTLLGASEGIPHPTLWYPTILGWLVVIAGIGLFCGSAYLLLATNLGARLGFLIAAAALSGFMVLISAMWLTTASPLNTLKGRVPSWKPIAQVDSLDKSTIPAVRQMQAKGKAVDPAEAANIKAAADAELVIPKQQGDLPKPVTPKFAKYQLPTEYVVADTREIGRDLDRKLLGGGGAVREHLNVDAGLAHFLDAQRAQIVEVRVGLVAAARFRTGEMFGEFRIPIMLFDGNNRNIWLFKHDASPATLKVIP